MDRDALLSLIDQELGRRRLVWFGTRGDDAEGLTDIPQFDASFSLINAYRGRSGIRGMALEDVTGHRVDLDAYDVDEHPRDDDMAEFRQEILSTLSHPSAVLTYRPSTFLSAITFSRQDRCRYLGMFGGHQAAFDHKPWVESLVADAQLPHIPWRYVPNTEQSTVVDLLREGPLMLRKSRTSGGTGLVLVREREQVAAGWPDQDEAYVSVARYIEDAIPVNVGAVVWHDGVTVHPASVQLIGIQGLTLRPFGYCGNDFAAVEKLSHGALRSIDSSTRSIAELLRGQGYRGAFGVDYLVQGDEAVFTEVNPRLQGSTHASCRLSIERQESCILIEHLAAFLGLDVPVDRPLWVTHDGLAPLSHVVLHNVGSPARVSGSDVASSWMRIPGYARADVLTRDDLVTDTGGTMGRVTVRDSVTADGFSLDPRYLAAAVDTARHCRGPALQLG